MRRVVEGPSGSPPTAERWWERRASFAGTALLLLVIFGWTFVTNPGRPAPADDPAYYTWRTEALVATEPATLLEVEGPRSMYAGGYRVTTPVIAGLLRSAGDVDILTPTSLLSVGLRVLIPLLLAGFAFRSRRDPLVFHSVAFGSASLLLTPPFGGYLDNVLTLFFLAAALFLFDRVRDGWVARIAFGVLLLLSGMTHPTTLAIFCVVLGAMAVVRWIYRRFDTRSVWQDDGPVLVTAGVAAVVTFLVWKVGIWGVGASLSEAALPPPADSDFFKTRLFDWLDAMRPALNGPLFLFGVVGLLLAGRRAAEDDLSRVAIVWLAPLVGIFGFLAGMAYPYYRFFNTTLSWILLIGIGIYFTARALIEISERNNQTIALVGLAALAIIIGTNFTSGFDRSNWNEPADAWVKPDEEAQLAAIRQALAEQPSDTPVVFIVDNEATEKVRVYGFAKLAGNVTRFGVPGSMQDHTAFYLGSIENFVTGTATERGDDDYYRDLSQESLDDVNAIVEDAGSDPIVILAGTFNESGSNVRFATGASVPPAPDRGQLWVALGEDIFGMQPPAVATTGDEDASPLRIVITLVMVALMFLPGLLLWRSLVPDGGLAEALGLVPALGIAVVSIIGIVAVAITRGPLDTATAWVVIAV
ncbi:MAG TPA: hypothetical protein VFS18_03870, partial [Actinomycetota bacterium]|nr:hypothetical protein [Actinomycetota bacterium]